MNQNITLHIPITYLGSTWQGDFKKLPANKTFTLVIDYPLATPAEFKIRTGKYGMGLIRLLKEIGKAYVKVYKMDYFDLKSGKYRYGIYGHDIDDLALSGIRVDLKKRRITLDVDS